MNKIILGFLFHLVLLACTERRGERDDEVVGTTTKVRAEMIGESIQKSKAYTLAILDQMPDSLYGYRPTEEVMTFSRHFIHNSHFTCSQLAERLDRVSPFQESLLAVDLNKEETLTEVHGMYDFMEEVLESLSDEELQKEVEFDGDLMPAWKMFDIVENHIIHHRGSCIIYMRMNGIVPQSYLGW